MSVAPLSSQDISALSNYAQSVGKTVAYTPPTPLPNTTMDSSNSLSPQDIAAINSYASATGKTLANTMTTPVTPVTPLQSRALPSATFRPSTSGGTAQAPKAYAPYVAQAAQKYGVPPTLINSIINRESGWNPNSRSSTSTATGLGQFLAGTAKQYGVNVNDPQSSIDGVGKYLSALYKQHGSWAGAVRGYRGVDDTKYIDEVLQGAGLPVPGAVNIGNNAQPQNGGINWASPNSAAGHMATQLQNNVNGQVARAPKPQPSELDILKNYFTSTGTHKANVLGHKVNLPNQTAADQDFGNVVGGIAQGIGTFAKGAGEAVYNSLADAGTAIANHMGAKIRPGKFDITDPATYQAMQPENLMPDVNPYKVAQDIKYRPIQGLAEGAQAVMPSDPMHIAPELSNHLATVVNKVPTKQIVQAMIHRGDIKPEQSTTVAAHIDSFRDRVGKFNPSFENKPVQQEPTPQNVTEPTKTPITPFEPSQEFGEHVDNVLSGKPEPNVATSTPNVATNAVPKPAIKPKPDFTTSAAKFTAASAHGHAATIETPEDVTQAFVHAGALKPEQAEDFHNGIIVPTIDHLSKQDGITPNEWVQKNIAGIVPGEGVKPATAEGKNALDEIEHVGKDSGLGTADDNALPVVKPGGTGKAPLPTTAVPAETITKTQPKSQTSTGYQEGHKFTININGEPKSTTLDTHSAALVNKINEEYNQQAASIKSKSYAFSPMDAHADSLDHPEDIISDEQHRQRDLKAVAMLRSAELRQATGLLTPKEEKNIASQNKANYDGKPVLVNGDHGIVTGKPIFGGRFKVTMSDGSVKTVKSDHIETDPNATMRNPGLDHLRSKYGVKPEEPTIETPSDKVTAETHITEGTGVKFTKTANDAKPISKSEKIDAHTGLTKTQSNYLTNELVKYAHTDAAHADPTIPYKTGKLETLPHYEHVSETKLGPPPHEIDVPNDGKYIVRGVQQANALHVRLTGEGLKLTHEAGNPDVPLKEPIDLNKLYKYKTQPFTKEIDPFRPPSEKYSNPHMSAEQKAETLAKYSNDSESLFQKSGQTDVPANIDELKEHLASKYPGVSHDIYESPKSGELSIGKLVVPAGNRGKGIGTSFMNDVARYADQKGRRIVLSPSTDFGGSSVERLKSFYNQFGFVENKGRNLDHSISETMYRDPKTVEQMAKNRDTLFQKSDHTNAPAFYSQAQRTVEQKMGNRMPAVQLEKTLLSNGVKPDEMKWSGLDDLIAQHKASGAPLTKQEVLDHIAANNVQIKEINKAGDDTRFDEYTLPGGKNYREILLSIPPKEMSKADAESQYSRVNYALHDKYGDGFAAPGRMNTEDTAALSKAIRDREIAYDTPNPYKSSHWHEPNVFAHVRMNDRVGPNGEKILHIEEIQSDINNDRLQGKNVPPMPFAGKEYELAVRRIMRYAAESGYDRVSWTPGDIQSSRFDMSKKIDRITYDPDSHKLEAFKNGRKTPIVSTFKNPDELAGVVGRELANHLLSTEKVKETVPFNVKSATYYPKHQRLGIAPHTGRTEYMDADMATVRNVLGEEGANRLLGAKPDYYKNTFDHSLAYQEKTGNLRGYDSGRYGPSKRLDISGITPEELRKRVGDEVADKLLSGQKNKLGTSSVLKHQTKEGLFVRNMDDNNIRHDADLSDLSITNHIPTGKEVHSIDVPKTTIGGSGKNDFYDKILSNYINKIGKKFGASVEPTRIQTEPGKNGMTRWGKKLAEVPSVKLTEAMKDSVLYEGQPLFQQGLGPEKEKGSITWNSSDGKALIKVFGSADFSTAAHEWSHLMRRSLKGDLLNTVEEHYGVENGNWGEKNSKGVAIHEEQFAKDFEAYTASGKAPKPALQAAFDKFKEWMGQIYKGIIGSPVEHELSPEMRQVFDKIYGKDTSENVHAADQKGATGAKPGSETVPEATPVIKKLSVAKNGTGQKYAGNLNLDRMGTTDDVRQGIIDYVNDHSAEIEKTRGGVIPMEETAKAAKELGLTVAQITKGKPASIPAQNWAMAVRDLLLKKEDDLRAAEREYKDKPTDENQLLLDKATQDYATVVHTTVGNAAEAGRTLNIHKVISKAINATESAANADLFKPIRGKIDPKTFGDSNRIFTTDRARIAKERLARILNQSAPDVLHQKSPDTLYQSAEPTGKPVDVRDPDTMKVLTDRGGYWLEGGIRNPRQWMKQMRSDIQEVGGTATDTDLMKVWNNLKIEAAQRQGNAKLPRTESAVIVDQVSRKLGRVGTQSFLENITHPDGSTPEFDKLADHPEELSPKERQFLTDAFKKSYRETQASKPITKRVALNPDLNDIARQARMQAKAERNVLATPVEAKNATRDLIAKRLSDGDREAFVKELGNVPEGDHKAFVNVVRKYSRMSVGDSLVGLWKAGLLSHVGTLPKVAIAHTAFNVAEEAKRIPAALADAAWSATHGTDRQVAGLSTSAMLNAAKIGATKGLAEAGILLKEGEAGLASRGLSQHAYKGVEIPSEYNANLGPFSQLANAYVNGVSRTHGAVYHVNKVYGFARSVDEQAQLAARSDVKNGLGNYKDRYEYYAQNPTTSMIMNAASAAEELTLQNKNGITETIQMAKGVAARHGVKPLVDVAVPFSTVPSNILLKGLEYTGGLPYGILKAIKATVLKEDFTPEQQRSWANTVGRGTVGAAAITLGMYLHHKGVVTPPDSNTYTPATLKVGDKYFPISDKAPSGTLLTIGAILDANSKTRDADIFNALTANAPMAENNPLTNIVQNPGAFAGQEVKGFVPGFVQDYAGHVDPSRRKTNVSGDTKQTFINTVQSGIPGERQKLQPNGPRAYDPADPLRLRNSPLPPKNVYRKSGFGGFSGPGSFGKGF